MKSFTLHLVVVFTLAALNQQIEALRPSASLSAPTMAHQRFNSTSSSKTPRTIQRIVAGHLQQHSLDKNNSSTAQLSRLYFRRKPSPARNPGRSTRNNTIILKKVELTPADDDDGYNDAAFLEDPKDLDNWDNGILRSSAGAGQEDKSKKKEEGKKTLSDQVAEGKYGLIEKELFQDRPKRPGVISYLSNKEVPGDNSKNLGGLTEDDIWLAEDHLLVLKGGSLNSKDSSEPWKPIDDYQAPSRQIKIPSNPKVPPPFPVQFEDGGPIQFIGDHKFPFFYPFENESLPLYPENGYFPPENNGYDEKNIFAGPGSIKNSTNGKSGYFYPPPFSPWLLNNETVVNPFLKYGQPPIPLPPTGFGPPFPFPPINGSLDGINDTDDIDEDDPSLYYPPPYSFVYKSNYSSPVPPGPLVPGIILPPPPNAFARLEEPDPKPPRKDIPFRQILTKITEYKPGVIITSTTPRTTTTTTTKTTKTTTALPTTSTTPSPPPRHKEVYYINKKPSVPDRGRPYFVHKQHNPTIPTTTTTTTTLSPPPPPVPTDFISFVPKIPSTKNSIAQGNPIYYEYFDSRKTPNVQNIYDDYSTILTTPAPIIVTTLPPSPPPPPQYSHQPKHHRTKVPVTTVKPSYKQTITRLRPQSPPQRLNKNYLPARPYDNYLFITPQPEIKPNGISNFLPFGIDQQYKTKVNFDAEIDSIRETLQYYKAQQLQQNQIPRAPKAKAVYEYSFDATSSPNRAFQPPSRYDEEPFKPMVQYSKPVNDVNGFKAITYTRPDGSTTPEPIYYTTSKPTHSTRLGGKAFLQPIIITTESPPNFSTHYPPNYIQKPPAHGLQYTSPRTPIIAQPWFSIEKQLVQEVANNRPVIQKNNQRVVNSFSRPINPAQRPFNGYNYERPPGNRRQNNRFFQYNGDDSFTQHLSSIRAQINQYQPQQLPISLENDTYVNYKPPRRPINPDSEFIQVQRRQQYQNLPQRLSPPALNPYQPISLNRDILVNYKLPLPPINPDSEYIQPQQIINRNIPPEYRPLQYNPAANQPPSNIYYITPQNGRYKKSN